MGHSAGDAVLRQISDRMKAAFRKGDIVSRLGGDEFVAFLPYAGSIGVVADKAEAFIADIGAIKLSAEQKLTIGVSIGAAEYPKDGSNFAELYKHADAALYRAKNSGKGKVVIYSASFENTPAEKGGAA